MIRGAGSMSAIEITRQDPSISRLRAEAARTADAKQARRILAIAMVLDAHARLLAAQAGAMDRRTPRDRGHRYNADGLGRMAWPGWWTGPGLGVGLVRPKPGGAKWRSGEVGGRRP